MSNIKEFLPVVALTIGAVYLFRQMGFSTQGGGNSTGY